LVCLRPQQVLVGEVPVHEVPEKRRDVVQPAVLIVEIVSMLPDIDGEQWPLAGGQRSFGIRRGDDAQLPVIEHQPRPAAAELVARGTDELLAEDPLASEGGLDCRGNRSSGFAASARPHALPQECVIPRLG
jgi:hypothetical protein